jgi:hypothetical protein
MRKAIAVVAVLGVLGMSSQAFAADDAPKEGATATVTTSPAKVSVKGARKYGAAGCGLGSIVFGNSPGIVQIFAATTNATFATQLYGITTGTSNCDESGPGQDSARIFIDANREALAKDISRGKGETIASLTKLAGCSDSNAVGMSLQKSFKVIFPNGAVSNETVSDQIITTLSSDKSLSCTL